MTVYAAAQGQIAVCNSRSYRATSNSSFDYRGGQLIFFIFDGNAFSDVECPFLPAGPGLLPFFPGALPCPPGHNAFLSTRFGDRDGDTIDLWGRLGSVDVATQIPSRVPELIEFVAGPITDFPRPSNDFVDRSTLVLFDLQTAFFAENDTTRYEFITEYRVFDGDINGDGERTPLEMEFFQDLVQSEELSQLRDTIITTGNTNGYLFTFPSLPFIQANRDLPAELAPTTPIAVNNLRFLEAFPGISARAGITNAETGFFFSNLTEFGTDFDGDPAFLVDFRLPGSLSWAGNDLSNLIPNSDSLFLQIFENRFDLDGVPLPEVGAGPIQLASVQLGEDPATDPVVVTAPFRLDQGFLSPTLGTFALGGHNLESPDEVVIYGTGFSALDGQRFFASVASPQAGFTAGTDFELFIDSGLTEPLLLTSFPDGSQGFINPEAPGVDDIPDIILNVNFLGLSSITTATPHGLAAGDAFTLEETGLSGLDARLFFANNVTPNTFDIFTDAELTIPFLTEIPDPTNLSQLVPTTPLDDPFLTLLPAGVQLERVDGAVIIAPDQNNLDFPIWPFPFVDDFFGGQLLLPSALDNGYEIPDVAFRIFFGTEFGARDLVAVTNQLGGVTPRNDLILRLRFQRNALTTGVGGGSALVPGDLSERDFELELCLVDTLEGAVKGITTAAANPLTGLAIAPPSGDASDSEEDIFGVDADLDGDGQSNLFEFAFDVNGSLTEPMPAFGDSSRQVEAQVSFEIDPETQLCELSIGKRPAVREYLEYYFEEVAPDGSAVVIDPEGDEWTLVEDTDSTYKIRSTEPVDGAAFYRACARKNSFGVELAQ